jgi:Concanavalin A-like lectin/glucanases superfamily
MPTRLLSIAAVLATTAIMTSSALGATGPIGVWKLNEGSGTLVADSSGNGNNGVISGQTSWVAGVFGGSGLRFDGSGRVKVNDNNALEPASAVTVSAWFRHGGSPGAYRYIAAKGANGCIAASYGLYSGPNGGLEFYVSKQRGSRFARSPDAGKGVWDGQWHLAVGTYDGTTIRLYVDGVQVGSGSAWGGSLEYLLPDSNDFYIGNYPGCTDHAFAGDVDDVVVWGRTLTAGEIADLPSGGTGDGTPVQTSPPAGGGDSQGSTGGTTGAAGTGGTTGGASGTGATTGGGSTAGSTPSATIPSVHGVKLSPSTVTVDPGGHVVVATSRGPRLSYTETQAARLTVALLRSETGVRRVSRCVTSSRRARTGGRCVHFVVVTRIGHSDSAGHVTLPLNGLLHRRLSPGVYRLDLTPRASGMVGNTVSVRLVVRRSRARHR